MNHNLFEIWLRIPKGFLRKVKKKNNDIIWSGPNMERSYGA